MFFRVLVLVAIGLVFLGMAISVRSGRSKGWYLRTYRPFGRKLLLPLCISLSLAWFTLPVVAILPIPKESRSVLGQIGMLSPLVLTPLLAIWQPWWLDPVWLRRLESQYDRGTIKALIENWRKMDRAEWGRLIETQQGLDELVRRAGVPVATTDRRGRPIER